MIVINLSSNVRYLLLLSICLTSSFACGQDSSQATNQNTESSAEQGNGLQLFEEVLISRVIDGDTVELASGETVRYLGIDTPETVHPSKPVECYGPEASERNNELVEGKIVTLMRDGPDTDQYDRLLRYVFVDGTFVNGDLVWGGYAYARSYGDTPLFYQTLVQLERSAREGERGLWEICD